MLNSEKRECFPDSVKDSRLPSLGARLFRNASSPPLGSHSCTDLDRSAEAPHPHSDFKKSSSVEGLNHPGGESPDRTSMLGGKRNPQSSTGPDRSAGIPLVHSGMYKIKLSSGEGSSHRRGDSPVRTTMLIEKKFNFEALINEIDLPKIISTKITELIIEKTERIKFNELLALASVWTEKRRNHCQKVSWGR